MEDNSKNFHTEVIYNAVIFALSAQRFIKVIAASDLSDKQKTWSVLYEMAYSSMVINLAKVVDDKSRGNVDIDRLLGARDYEESQRQILLERWNTFKVNHQDAIRTIVGIRSNLTAHFNRNIHSLEDAAQFVHNTEPVQKLMEELLLFIENLPWFAESMRQHAPEYTDFANELRFTLQGPHQAAIEELFRQYDNS